MIEETIEEVQVILEAKDLVIKEIREITEQEIDIAIELTAGLEAEIAIKDIQIIGEIIEEVTVEMAEEVIASLEVEIIEEVTVDL